MTVLLAANDGGHITQLHLLSRRLAYPEGAETLWLTVATPQTESLLAGEKVHWLSPAKTRDMRAVARNTASAAQRIYTRTRFTHALSTGSSVALSVLPVAASAGAQAVYMESATRYTGFSLTGRILSRTPGIRCYTQYEHLRSTRWGYAGSVFDGFETFHSDEVSRSHPLRIVVSVGTSESFPFLRMIERLHQIIPSDSEVLWQTGSTDTSHLDIDARPAVPMRDLESACLRADVVVAHAGTGIALTALRCGKVPVLVPRDPYFGEHIDDHQTQLATMLGERELALVRSVDEISINDLNHVESLEVRFASTKRLDIWT